MLRSLAATTTPESPVSLEEAKLAARIDTSDMDTHVADLLAAAVGEALRQTKRTLCTTQWLLQRPDWPAARIMELPRPPLVSVESMRYYDSAGVLRTLSAESYAVDTAPLLGRICLLPNESWPGLLAQRADAVQVAYTAGYGDPSDVPPLVKVGIKKLVSYWFHQAASDVPPEIDRIFQAVAVQSRGYEP